MADSVSKEPVVKKPRNLIALLITACILLVTIFIGIHSIFSGDEPDYSFVAQTLLPLWGTWVGTILAFYFGKENFDAATKSYQDVIKTLTPEEKIAQLSVKEVMIPLNEIELLEYDKEKDTSVHTILNYARFAPFNRFAIVDANDVIQYIVHRSTFYQFISEQVDADVSSTNIRTITLQHFIENSSQSIKKVLLKGFSFVSSSSNLLEAKHAMDTVNECQDVFITKTGKATEPIMGLVTNNMILKQAYV